MAKGINKYEGMSEDTKRMLRGEPLIRREDYLCSEEQDQIDQMEHRIADLERERALLLVYAKAARALIATVGTETEGLPDAEGAAWWALIDAGLLESDE